MRGDFVVALSGFERARCSSVANALCAGHWFHVDELVRFSRAARRAKGVKGDGGSCCRSGVVAPGASTA